MIQYDKDGATLFYTDANGAKISAGVFDGKKYNDMDTVMLQQIAAVAENSHAVESYNLSLQTAQTSVDAGRGNTVSAPPKPLSAILSSLHHCSDRRF